MGTPIHRGHHPALKDRMVIYRNTINNYSELLRRTYFRFTGKQSSVETG